MDRDFADLARRVDKPYYVVDSLLWMRNRIPPVLAVPRLLGPAIR